MQEVTTRRLCWAATNGAVVTSVVWGVASGDETAANVFKFLAWLSYLPVILILLSDKATALARKKGPSVSPYLSFSVDMAVAVLLAAHGWFGYAALVGASGACLLAVYDKDAENEAEE